ncbi:MAG: hypothetical protein A2X48_04755 [Lentisphaerae bacterium GWF2_49_21]|nr:MAG: hypothetical protein A2X48_04755 [Lentisphaerae bacterium GWF2_49_21]
MERAYMQYFQPKPGYYVGDCMPFYHDGIFHLFYLLDEGHHQGKGGLGGHQWAHCSSRDLVHWKHHPLAVPLEEDWEGSICTGSTFYDKGQYHAFYATRKPDHTQHLSHAVSDDCIKFRKLTPNPFASSLPGFSPKDCRDPFIFKDETGRYNMLVTSKIEQYPLHDRGGCLLRYTSKDLSTWKFEGIFLIPVGGTGWGGIPECPDHFFWKGWYYLLFGIGLQTFYRMSKKPFGPWQRPQVDVLDSHLNAVMKTAPFGKNRRIGVGWIGPRKDNKDSEWMLWGGQTVFREIIQNRDGTLGVRFLKEMIPSGKAVKTSLRRLTSGAKCKGKSVELISKLPKVGRFLRNRRFNTDGSESHPYLEFGNFEIASVELNAAEKLEVAAFENLPMNYNLNCVVRPKKNSYFFGFGLRGSGNYESKFDFNFDCHRNSISLGKETILSTVDLGRPFKLEIILKDDIIDICIDNRQCIINRCHELKGNSLFLACQNGVVRFEKIEIQSLCS